VSHGLVVGSFLPYHQGHADLIRAARAQVEALTVLVCTGDEDPIPGGVRYEWVRVAHQDCDVIWVHDGTSVPEMARRRAATGDLVVTAEPDVPARTADILADPMHHWSCLPPHVRPYFVRRVALVGGESTGKTTLCTQLAREFETTWVPEYGRLYCEVGRPAMELTLVDFEAIAWGQATWEDEAARTANRVLLCDTDLHVTATWSDIVVGQRPGWLTAAARARHYDLVLLLHHDVPWRSDDVRVLGDRRAEHTDRIRRELEEAGRPIVTVSGNFEERTAAATAAIRRTLEP
jgi:NadR type nicotinamide-nucleotide adenylyltransferase